VRLPSVVAMVAVDQLGTDETMMSLQKLKIWEKLSKGELHKISKENVEELFVLLDKEERGEISSNDLMVLQQVPDMCLTQEDIENLCKDADRDLSGKVGIEELWQALTQGEIAYNLAMQTLGQRKALKTTECKKEDLVAFLRAEYNTKSALKSLPQTCILFLAFFISMTAHLGISESYLMQNGIVQEIEGEGPFWLHKMVHDIPTTWEWMLGSFVNCHFKQDLVVWPHPGRVASYNQIVGGIKLARLNSVPAPCSQDMREIYDSRFGGRCFKTSETLSNNHYIFYHDRYDDIVEQLSNLSNSHWLDQNTTKLDIDILFYNAHLHSYSVHKQTFNFAVDGFVSLYFSHETFLAEPYRNIFWIIPDIIFAIILLRMLYSEMLELVPACMAGLDGFYGYLEFWNVIDWLAIIIGFGLSVMWGLQVKAVTDDLPELISQLQTEALDYAVYEKGDYLTPAEFEKLRSRSDMRSKIGELHDTMGIVGSGHAWIRSLVFVYSFVLMMKFFKAFQANPRLNIVIKTMRSSATDIVHFMMVFSVIFIVFSSAAYVCFGYRLKAFHTHFRSIMTCWRNLMGDFDMDSMELIAGQDITYVWMVCFQFLVLLVLLNMLLAIIMDTYAAVNQPDSLSIWTQVLEAAKTARETRGHVDMWYLIVKLEDDDYQLHPDNTVTSKSLRRAFQTKQMTKLNAEYLIRKSIEFVKAKEATTDLRLSDAVRLLSRMNTAVFRNCESTDQLLHQFKQFIDGPKHERFDAIMAGNDPDEQQTSLVLPHHRLRQAARVQMVPEPPSLSKLSVLRSTDSGGADAVNGEAAQRPPSRNSVQRPDSVGADAVNGEATQRPQSRNSVQLPQSQNSRTSNLLGPPAQSQSSNGLADDVQRTSSKISIPMAPSNSGGTYDQDILLQLGQVQVAIDVVRSEHLQIQQTLLGEFREIRYYIEQRDTWLEQRLHAVDRRLEKVEKANDRVSAGMQGFNHEELSVTLDSLKSALERSDGGRRTTVQLPRGKEDGLQASSHMHSVTTPGNEVPFDDFMRLNFEKNRRHMEQKLDKMLEQVQQVLTHQEGAAETLRLLWKIDLSLRQMRTGSVVTSPLPQDSVEQATRSAAASSQAPRPSISATTHTPSDRRASANTGNQSRPTSRASAPAVVVGTPMSNHLPPSGRSRAPSRYRDNLG